MAREYFADDRDAGSRINEDANAIKRKDFYRTVRRRRSLPVADNVNALVSCERMHARLSMAACVRRYTESAKPPPQHGAITAERAQYTACVRCAQGEERAE
jgi:hypothetical protein